jgi:ammonium transporter, Amt family
MLAITSMLTLLTAVPGVAMFQCGMARSGSIRSSFMSHLLTVASTTVLWITIGYTCVYSTEGMVAGAINARSLVGGLDKVLLGTVASTDVLRGLPEFLFVLHSMKHAIISACIMLGGLLERTRMAPRIITVALWSMLVYVPVSHTVSGGPGALLGDIGVLDAAGPLHVLPFECV